MIEIWRRNRKCCLADGVIFWTDLLEFHSGSCSLQLVCHGTVVCVVGVLLLPEIQPQDRVQKAVWQAAQTPGGHQQAACADCQREHPQARDTATQSWYTARAVGFGHTDGTVAGTDDTDNWCSGCCSDDNVLSYCTVWDCELVVEGLAACSGCCSDDSVLSYCAVWDCELVVEGLAACIFMATKLLKTETTHASRAAEQTQLMILSGAIMHNCHIIQICVT